MMPRSRPYVRQAMPTKTCHGSGGTKMDKLSLEDTIDNLAWELTKGDAHNERVKGALREFAREIMRNSGVAFRERG